MFTERIVFLHRNDFFFKICYFILLMSQRKSQNSFGSFLPITGVEVPVVNNSFCCNGEKQIMKWARYLRLKVNCISPWEMRFWAILHCNMTKSLVLIFHNTDFRAICFHQKKAVPLLLQHYHSTAPLTIVGRAFPPPFFLRFLTSFPP